MSTLVSFLAAVVTSARGAESGFFLTGLDNGTLTDTRFTNLEILSAAPDEAVFGLG
jgi:hypothetical protein